MSAVRNIALVVYGLAFAILALLRLVGVVDWPWLAITALLWVPAGIAAVVAFILLLLLLWAMRGVGGVP